jgi:hypothetical protein
MKKLLKIIIPIIFWYIYIYTEYYISNIFILYHIEELSYTELYHNSMKF